MNYKNYTLYISLLLITSKTYSMNNKQQIQEIENQKDTLQLQFPDSRWEDCANGNMNTCNQLQLTIKEQYEAALKRKQHDMQELDAHIVLDWEDTVRANILKAKVQKDNLETKKYESLFTQTQRLTQLVMQKKGTHE